MTMKTRQACYIVISPVRNEERHVGLTISSMVKQTVLPAEWIIVNDGSTDGTAKMLREASAARPWIRVVDRPDRGSRKPGGGVMEAFYDGHAVISRQEWGFLVKLDGDLSFEPGYFEKCLEHFRREPTLCIGGGTVCVSRNGRLEPDSPNDPPFHVRGATKIYRRDCWEGIGGLIRSTGWDTMDEVKANMLGWRTRTFADLSIQQLKPTGSADGMFRNWVKNGRANYICGYHPLFMLLKCLQRLFTKPYGVAGLGLLGGFLGGYVQGLPQIEDKEVIKYLRRQQINRLLRRRNLWAAQDPGTRSCEEEQVQL